jgi:hypothetical protein
MVSWWHDLGGGGEATSNNNTQPQPHSRGVVDGVEKPVGTCHRGAYAPALCSVGMVFDLLVSST